MSNLSHFYPQISVFCDHLATQDLVLNRFVPLFALSGKVNNPETTSGPDANVGGFTSTSTTITTTATITVGTTGDL